MTIPGTVVFKMRIGNALRVLGRVSLALVRTTIWGRAGMFRIADYLSRFAGMFSPDRKANTRAG
jgi:hypothetical protein